MDILRRIFSFRHRSGDSLTSNNLQSIPGYYLGHTYAAQPNSDELQRAAHILVARNKKDMEKNNLPILSACFETTSVILRNGKNLCCEFEIRRIVVSCVDAKNQKLLAIFYHNDSPFIASPMTSRGLECHLFLCHSKEVAKLAANKVGELLAKEYSTTGRPTSKVSNGQNRLSKQVDEFDYENISKFFHQKVLHNSSDYQNRSMFSTPSSSISTFVATTGYDSGRASSAPSVDIKSDDFQNGYIHTIHEYDETDSDIQTSSNDNTNNIPDTQTRYSVHYNLDDFTNDLQCSNNNQTSVKIDIEDIDSVSYTMDDIENGELEKLLHLDETDL